LLIFCGVTQLLTKRREKERGNNTRRKHNTATSIGKIRYNKPAHWPNLHVIMTYKNMEVKLHSF
jgi:hypothetical protein